MFKLVSMAFIILFLALSVSCKTWERINQDNSGTLQVSKSFGDEGEEYKIVAYYHSLDFGAGKDGEYLTGDDRVAKYDKVILDPENIQFALSDNATIKETRSYMSAGADNLWFTEDDDLSAGFGGDHKVRYEVLYENEGVLRGISYASDCGSCDFREPIRLDDSEYSGGGFDESTGIFFSNPANFEGYLQVTTSEKEGYSEKKYEIFTHPGLDNIWFTEDDTFDVNSWFKIPDDWLEESTEKAAYWHAYWLERLYDDGRKESINYSTTGEDKLRFTEDDELLYKTSVSAPVAQTDGNFETVKVVESFSENIGNTMTKLYSDSDGKLLKRIWYDSPGVDGEWHTEDDVIRGIEEWITETISDNQVRILEVYYFNAGKDKVWFSEDDHPDSYSSTTITTDQDKVENITAHYMDPGKDGVWFSNDDVAEDAPSTEGELRSYYYGYENSFSQTRHQIVLK